MKILFVVAFQFGLAFWIIHIIGKKIPLLKKFFQRYSGLCSIGCIIYWFHLVETINQKSMGVFWMTMSLVFLILFMGKLPDKFSPPTEKSDASSLDKKQQGWVGIDISAGLIALITYYNTTYADRTRFFIDYWDSMLPFIIATAAYSFSKFISSGARSKKEPNTEENTKIGLIVVYTIIAVIIFCVIEYTPIWLAF